MGELARGCGAAGHEHGSRGERAVRGSLRSDTQNGRVRVWVDEGRTEGEPDAQIDREALLESKDKTISILRNQLRLRAEEIQRREVITSQLTQANAALAAKVSELKTPQTSEDGTQEPAEGAIRPPQQAGAGATAPQNASERVPWWHRLLGEGR
jgi:hypothetical protein